MYSNLSDIIISHGLNLPSPKIDNLKDIPKGCFGVFITVKRSTKLNHYPKEIHGCIGYWDNSLKDMSKKSILQKI